MRKNNTISTVTKNISVKSYRAPHSDRIQNLFRAGTKSVQGFHVQGVNYLHSILYFVWVSERSFKFTDFEDEQFSWFEAKKVPLEN